MSRVQSGRVRIEEGVVFGKGGDRELRCDVFLPPEAGADRPSVLLIHGGGWLRGDRTQLRGYGILLGRLGYVCLTSEYRLSGEAKWPAQIHDSKAALRFMRTESRSLGIDPAKISVSGNSAGGHLSLMLAATPNLPELEGEGGHAGAGTQCAATIAFYAPTQLAALDPESAVTQLFQPGVDAQTVRAASPISYVRKDFPPTLLIHGNRDETVPDEASFGMYRALAEAGAPVELHLYNGAPHAFDATRDLGRQCAELMALFLDRHVADPRPVVVPATAR